MKVYQMNGTIKTINAAPAGMKVCIFHRIVIN